MARPNIRTVNRLIAQHHPGYQIIQEDGCVRVLGPDTHEWASSCFMVYRVSHQSPEEWVADVGGAKARKSTEF